MGASPRASSLCLRLAPFGSGTSCGMEPDRPDGPHPFPAIRPIPQAPSVDLWGQPFPSLPDPPHPRSALLGSSSLDPSETPTAMSKERSAMPTVAKTPPPPARSPATWRALTSDRAWIFCPPIDHKRERNFHPLYSAPCEGGVGHSYDLPLAHSYDLGLNRFRSSVLKY